MKIRAIEARDIPPVKLFSVDSLSNIVVIAGPNGVGKTRLVEAMLFALHYPGNQPNISFIIDATAQTEIDQWGKLTLDTSVEEDTHKLRYTVGQSSRRTSWTSTVVQFESNRAIPQIPNYGFSFDISDPFEEITSGDLPFSPLRDRFYDTQHSILRKIQSQDKDIVERARERMKSGKATMPLKFPDPLAPFKEAFRQLLAPKEMVEPDLRQQQLQYSLDGQILSFSTLSSGEREVAYIVFDFLLHNASHSIIFFDEPELHLHPELSYKLLQTLRSVGANNQFIFVTHSPDIITASLEHSVVFVAPPKGPEDNQAIVMREDDETYQALNLLGQSIGIISLGRKLVLIEGQDTSLDKLAYGAVLKGRFPNLVLVPSGGKELISSFSEVVSTVLERTIWGVQFFMLCDRDALPASTTATDFERKASGRLKVLHRYHLENYFLDENVLASVFSSLAPEGSWLRNPVEIKQKLKDLARGMISYATALIVSAHFRIQAGNLDIMPKQCHGKSVDELTKLIADRAAEDLTRINTSADVSAVETMVRDTFAALEQSLNDADDTWKQVIPGKPLLGLFASSAKLNVGWLKNSYIVEAEKYSPNPFSDIISIFEHFANS